MGKAKPLKDIGQFFEGMVRDTVGNLIGHTQHERRIREQMKAKDKRERTATFQKYRASDIEAFAKIGGQMTEKTEAELKAAKPVTYTETKDINAEYQRDWDASGGKLKETRMGRRLAVEREYAEMADQEKSRIQGLYNKSMTRLGAIRQSRLRPGARKQSLITRKY
tara:strand:- start:1 stop:498 length:498 start_codon:yes stop_codon:yes gene_type:complete